MSDFFENIVKKHWDELDERVKREIEAILLSQKGSYTYGVLKCESPIEQLLLVHLLRWYEYASGEFRYFDTDANVRLFTQKEVEYRGNKYRIDIVIEVDFMGKTYRFAIECDGHEFHEKTKEQALRDKRRERNLMSLGFHVIRFTGSEIWNSPSKVAWEVVELIKKVTGYSDCLIKMVEEDMLSS
ncbi:DUF559 domain-containing protein [Geobacillus thermodenitrificans]|uniref:DUF559 domain-containing protein n=1 Tax=Geobacillus thermodenitrificans TaxID=33940 RepID=A0ABY9Q9V2_GEOTD|nr:DUF559 domain-containing protein [Geobacillus thermodenitrificans]WMV75331.1 DUF559 domain-containing protein [Geobacillus thermodenitrificans]